MIQLVAPASVSCWGVAPEKHNVQLEMLGMWFCKIVYSGFIAMVMLYTPVLLKVMTEDGDVASAVAQNGFKPPFKLADLEDFVNILKEKQAAAVIAAMKDYMWSVPCGSGSMVVVPQGWLIVKQTMLGNAVGLRCIFFVL